MDFVNAHAGLIGGLAFALVAISLTLKFGRMGVFDDRRQRPA